MRSEVVPSVSGSRPSAGHHALKGAPAGGPLRESCHVVPQIRRELVREADALGECQRAADKYVSHREALADEILAAVQSVGHRARGLVKAPSRSGGAVGVALGVYGGLDQWWLKLGWGEDRPLVEQRPVVGSRCRCQ